MAIEAALKESGSSPRVRGTGHPADQKTGQERFIPAGAGNGWCKTPSASGFTVHPRGCGERNQVHVCRYSVLGSSPRVRGTAVGIEFYRAGLRFIPAGAGNG